MANRKKSSKTDKRIQKKRQKLQEKSLGLDESYGRDISQQSSSNKSRKAAAAGSSTQNTKSKGGKAKASKADSSKQKTANSRGRKSQIQDNKTGLSARASEDRYAFGSFSYDEYKQGAFRQNGYEYREPATSKAEPAEMTRAERKKAVRRAKRRMEADTSRITPLNRNRLVLGFFAIVFLMTLLIFRMGYWQIIRADELKTMAASMQKVDTELDPVRGTIYDSGMNVLAEAVTEYELYGYSQYLYKDEELEQKEKDDTVRKLVEITGEEEANIIEKLSEPNENLVLLADGLTREQVEKAEEYFDSLVTVKTRASRYYPNKAFAAQILGGVSSDNVGRSGLEYEYNSTLAGIKGRTVRTTDRDGNTVSGSKTKSYAAKDGDSIVTTVDSVIQNFVEEAIAKGMKRTGASQITCIVMNPKTGDILAMATAPEFDPNNSFEPYTKAEKEKFNKMSDDEKTEYLSRMWTINGISNVYEPGSTFKLITAASAIDSGTSNEKSTYQCNGSIHVGGYNLRCLGVHGKQSLKEAVGNSCNPGLAKVALDMGAETFYNYIDMFGFCDKTGVDLPGETNSIVKSAEGMGDVDLATTGYGQGIAVTPLQILCAVNSFGNDGVLMKPKLVKKIIDSNGNTVKEIEDTAVRQVVSKETADKMCDIMEYYVAESGSGGQAYVPGYRVGGKTGTANLVEGSRYSSNRTNTSFVAMAPMDDPQISMICIVYRPTKVFYGNFTAGPIIKEVMEKSLQYMGVERQYTKEEAKEAKKEKVKVPDVTGENSKSAIRQLKNKGLSYIISPDPQDENAEFVVIDQNPKAGTKVEKGSVVYIYSE